MYRYEEHKDKIFKEENQVKFLKLRDRLNRLIDEAGCVSMGCATKGIGGDSWLQMAMVDRLVELGEIYEVIQAEEPLGQYRIFMKRD